MAKTKEYIVLKPGVTLKPGDKIGLKVGSTVKLTEDQAACRVNKVQLKSEVLIAPRGEDGGLGKRLSDAEESIRELTAERDGLQLAYDKSLEAVEALTAERDELVKAQVK